MFDFDCTWENFRDQIASTVDVLGFTSNKDENWFDDKEPVVT